jgi:hypothetical protein
MVLSFTQRIYKKSKIKRVFNETKTIIAEEQTFRRLEHALCPI